jgi:hypothetical protein
MSTHINTQESDVTLLTVEELDAVAGGKRTHTGPEISEIVVVKLLDSASASL